MHDADKKAVAPQKLYITVKRADSSGRILYDAESILKSASAKRHFAALTKLRDAGRIPAVEKAADGRE